MKNRLIASLLALLAMAALLLPVRATQTDNHGIHAVPAPGPVMIDGKLDDWDLSGQIFMCYDIESLKDVYSAKIAAMYDADNLYLSVHWTDPNPMCNSHDPHYQAGKAWAGDCVQFRFKTDKISHLTCWYYGPKNEPAIQISTGKDLTHPFGGPEKQLFQTDGWKLTEGAEEAFLKDADGKGYVQELKLPWKLITDQKQYHAGDALNMGIELLWGPGDWPVHRYADNMNEGYSSREFFFTNIPAWGPLILEPKGNLKLPPPDWELALRQQEAQGPVDITYDLPEDARVTLAIDDADGKRVRNLVPSLARTKGSNTEHWDGLDDKGLPVPPGKYNFKALYHHGIHVNYAMSFANPGNPTWDTADGRGAFYGDHSAPQAVAAAGDYVALGCPIGEAGKHLIGCDLNGQRLWGLANRPVFNGGRISLASDGKLLWIALDKAGSIYRVEAATGKFAPWNKTAKDESGHDFQVLDLPVFDPAALPSGPGYTPNMCSLAVNGATLAVALADDGTIKLLDKETGDSKGEIKIEQPRSIAFDQDGSLIVLSKDQIVRATTDGKITPFATESFPDGYGLAIDSRRNIYLSVRGTDQNVKEFSPDGKLAREIGKHGGRPHIGPFDDAGMCEPAAIAIDSKDRLWVTEETRNPKRTSIWNTTDGTLVKDLVGTTSYAGAGAINPFDPTMAFSDNTVYRIDLGQGTWRPVYSLGRVSDPSAIFPTRADSHIEVVKHGADTYVYTSDRSGDVLGMILRDGKWRVASATGTVPKKNDGEQDIDYENPLFAGHIGEAYSWADKNGDGLVQADELQFAPGSFRGCYWGELPESDGTIVYMGDDFKSFCKFPIQGYTDCGAPIYDVSKPQVVVIDQAPGMPADGFTWRGGNNGVDYLLANPLLVVDKSGHVLGSYPNKYNSVHGSHDATSARPGLLIGLLGITGIADMGGDIGDIFSINGNLGENYLFTSDGLLVQALFKDTRGQFDVPDKAIPGMPMDTITEGGESFGADFIRIPSGKVYLINGGTDAKVLEVTGLDGIKRFSGSFTYTPELYAQAQDFNRKAAVAKNLSKVYTIPKATAPVTIDGKADEWPELNDETKPLIEIQESSQIRFGRVAARYDDQNLYLAYHVLNHDNKIHNAGQDYKMLFKTGDDVDLMLGPGGPNKTGAGNLRLLFSMLGGQPTAVLYEKTVPGTAEKARVEFSAGWHAIYFDRVTQPDDVKVAVAPYPGGGYFVEAAIPWSRLGVTPSSGLKLRSDFGILSADSGGTVTVSRKYWSNKSTGLVNDVPGEADLEPQLWGELVLQ
jgi:WD40 repeat protein